MVRQVKLHFQMLHMNNYGAVSRPASRQYSYDYYKCLRGTASRRSQQQANSDTSSKSDAFENTSATDAPDTVHYDLKTVHY